MIKMQYCASIHKTKFSEMGNEIPHQVKSYVHPVLLQNGAIRSYEF
jgi:hypothetical protein